MYLMGFPVAARMESAARRGVAVELGEHDAVDAEGFVKRGGGVHGVLSGHGVHDQQDLVRLHRRLDALELVHELLVDVQAAGGIEEDDVVAVVPGVFDGLDRDGDGVDLPHLEHGQAELGADDLKLRDGRGTVQSQAASSGRLPCRRRRPASLATFVVCPRPEGRPSSRPSAGCWQRSSAFAPPIRAVSSSLTILMTCWAGVRLSSTSAPTARSDTLATKS